MKSLFLFICIFFVSNIINAQTFADPNFAAVPLGGGGWDFPTGATFSQDGQKLFVWQKGGEVYVCQRDGSGNYIKQAEAVIDLSAEVADWDAHGLVGFTLDPNFQSNGLIYLLYVVNRHHLLYFGTPSYNPGTNGTGNATIGRVTRYKTITSSGHLVADLSTRKILIGETKETGMPILHHSHGVGSLAFAADGTLLVSMGDAASYEGIDAGSFSGTFYQQALADGIIRPAENVGAFRSQMLTSMNGKLLRIDPVTGDGIPSNPFYIPGQPRATKSRVYAFGMRNCFRITVRPGTGSTDPSQGDIGEIYMGDVGFASWEELNIVKAPGMNFGWPIYEGNEYTIPLDGGPTYNDLNVQNLDEPNPLYGTGGCTQQYLYFRQLIKQANPNENMTLNNPCNSSIPIGTGYRYYHSRPALEWSHAHPWTRVGIFNGNNATVAMIGTPESQVVGTPAPGSCAVGGVWYTGGGYPSQYQDTYFQADFVGPLSGSSGPWLKRLSIDFTDKVTRVDDFATGFQDIVCVTKNPINGNLVTVQMLENGAGIKEIVYGGNQPPIAKPESNKTFGPSPLSVNFTGSNSYDLSPGGSIASYSWNFGGGSPATSNAANPGNIVFTEASGNPRKFVVTLTVTDNGGATNTESIIISVNNTPPVVNITSPIKNSLYNPGPDTLYACTATVTDAQHSAGQLTYEWQTSLRHNTHEHREAIKNEVNSSTLIQRVGFYGNDVYYWLIELTVTDAAGLSTKDSAKIYPNRSGADNTPPVVSVVSPVNGTTGVSTGTNVTASFNEAINASTVTGTTFQLKNAANNIIAASVNTSSNQITLTPSASLVGSTVYTATIKGGTSGVKDLAGNALVNDYSWTFTTGAVDNVPPTITSVSPVSGANGVNIGSTVTANFNEAVNASTVNATTFQLKGPDNNVVSSTINTSSNQITITPSAALAGSTVYTATIKGGSSGVKDVAGNALASDYSWSFTTSAAAAQSPVTIYSITTKTGTAAIAHQLTGVPAGALLVLATTGDAVPSDCSVSSSPSLTWTKRVDAEATNSANSEIWTAVYAAGGAITITSNWGSENSQSSVCYVVLNAEPSLAGAFATGVLQSAPSVTITTTRDNSIIFGCTADWKAVDGTTRTLRDAATERLYFKDGNYTTYHYTKAASSIAAYTEGVSLPTGQQASTALLEIRSTAAPASIQPTVTTHPTSQTRCTGANASFTSAADGTPVPTIQWQQSINGTTWINLSGATNSSLTFATTTADNNKQYRAVWTNSGGFVNSDPATLTVNSPATPTITVVNNCGNSVLTAGSYSGTLLWSNGATTGSITVTTAGSYTVTQSLNGCVSSSQSGTAAPKGTPQLTGSLTATASSGTAFTYTAASTIAGTTFAWSRATVAGISNAAANGTGNISETLTNTTTSPVSVTYVYTLTANGCTNTQSVVVTVNPVPAGDCTISNTSLSSNFSATAIPAGRYIWFNSSFDPGPLGTGTDPVTLNITNGVITFTANNVPYTLSVPNARIRFDATVTSASTQFVNNVWETVIPRSYTADVFMSGLSYPVPVNFPGNYMNVNWTADISIDKTGISLGWRWAAAVYTSFAGHAGINVKPINGSTQNPYPNTDRASTPENFKSFVVDGARGTGGTNYTGSFTAVNTATCTGGNPIPPPPSVTVVNNCGNSVLTAGSFSGSLLWSNGATTASITVATAGTYSVTQTLNGYTSAAASGTAAPKAIPQLSGSLSAIAASGTVFTYSAASATAGTTFAWSRGTVTGISNAAASGTGNISETLVNTTTSPVNVTYVYTLTANGCTNTQSVVVTVNPVPGCTISNSSLSSNFNATAIPAGRHVWFNSSFDPGPLGTGTDPVTVNITNGVITFTANNVPYTLSVPNARIRFDATVTSASTQFVNNVWETVIPRSYTSDVFMSGLSYAVPVNFPGNYMNVTWTADISIDKPGISLGWRWAAAVYTSFAGHTGINVKPINGSTQNPYPNTDRASTPENFKSFVVDGARGTGGTNYTGSFSTINTVTCAGQRSSLNPPFTQLLLPVDSLSKEKLDINVMPNPSNTYFSLAIGSENKNSVQVRVTNIFGQVLERHDKVASNTIMRLGQSLSSGTYFVEIIQGKERRIVKIIKVN